MDGLVFASYRKQPQRVSLPCQPQVHVIGRGQVPPDHYQLPDDLQIVGVKHQKFHVEPHIPEDEIEQGASRFYQWHFDGALYDIPPPRVGCLLAVRTPKGPDCTVRWEDDEGTTMKIGPGATACKCDFVMPVCRLIRLRS